MNTQDKKAIAKYMEIINQFIDQSIDVSKFESKFIEMRRSDKYWLSGFFNKNVEEILDTLFLDVSDYTPKELYEPNDAFNINEEELYKRVSAAKTDLERML